MNHGNVRLFSRITHTFISKFNSLWETYLQEGENLLGEVIVEILVFAVRHIVNENQTMLLSVCALKGCIQLVHNTL